MRTVTRLVVAASVAVLVVGCADDDPTGAPPPEDAARAPDGDAAEDGGSEDDDAAEDGGSRTDVLPVPSLRPGPDGIDHWAESRVEVADGALTLGVKVAATDERRQQGLMQVPALPDEAGMLFLFDEPRTGGFWMKDTLVPLDIAYLADGEIVSILQMDPCEADPCPVHDPGLPYDAALEVRQGRFAETGVTVGDRVTWTEPTEPTEVDPTA